MNAPRSWQKLTTAILLVLTTTILLLTMLGTWFAEPESVEIPTVQLPELPDERSLRSIDFDEDDPVFTKPLFWLGRRPPAIAEPPPEEVSEPQAMIDDIELLGVLIASGSRSALIKSAGEVERLQAGDSVAGWKIDSITEGQVTFTAGAERAVVRVVKPVSPGIHLETP